MSLVRWQSLYCLSLSLLMAGCGSRAEPPPPLVGTQTKTDMPSAKDSELQTDDLYKTLRAKMLALKSSDLGLTVSRDTPWALIFDQRIGDVVATLVVLATGDASLYLTTCMVVIGGGTHAQIRKATTALLADATLLKSLMQTTKEHPLPAPGQMNFYLVADAGSWLKRAPETEIRNG